MPHIDGTFIAIDFFAPTHQCHNYGWKISHLYESYIDENVNHCGE